jgi:hypothetical protein
MEESPPDIPMLSRVKSLVEPKHKTGFTPYYTQKIEELEI